MQRLLADYLRRYRWALLILLFAPLDCLVKEISFFGLSALVGSGLFLYQQRTGSARVWRTLPVERRAVKRAA